MGFLDKAKAAAQQATEKAKEGVSDVQTKRELSQAYDELGKKTFELAETGALKHAEIDPIVAQIRELKAKLEEEADGGSGNGTAAASTSATTEPPASSGPPAMPT